MQYKIPVQIENEDPIVLWLSLRQLAIIIIWWSIAYTIFTSLAPNLWKEIALIPSIIIAWLSLLIALFKFSEMTFVPYLLSFIRYKSNIEERVWIKWVDSFQPIDVWFLANKTEEKEHNIDFSSKIDKINELKNKVNKI